MAAIFLRARIIRVFLIFSRVPFVRVRCEICERMRSAFGIITLRFRAIHCRVGCEWRRKKMAGAVSFSITGFRGKSRARRAFFKYRTARSIGYLSRRHIYILTSNKLSDEFDETGIYCVEAFEKLFVF